MDSVRTSSTPAASSRSTSPVSASVSRPADDATVAPKLSRSCCSFPALRVDEPAKARCSKTWAVPGTDSWRLPACTNTPTSATGPPRSIDTMRRPFERVDWATVAGAVRACWSAGTLQTDGFGLDAFVTCTVALSTCSCSTPLTQGTLRSADSDWERHSSSDPRSSASATVLRSTAQPAPAWRRKGSVDRPVL
jgi:hypothetical protein